MSALVSLLAPCASTPSTPSTAATPVLATVLSTLTAEATLIPATLVRYSNPSLGFAVDHSADWRVKALADVIDPRAQPFPGGRKLQHCDDLTKDSPGRAGRAMVAREACSGSPFILSGERQGNKTTGCTVLRVKSKRKQRISEEVP